MARARPAELNKLDFFAGEWKSEATVRGAPGSSEAKYTSTSHGKWMEGGFFLVEHWEFELDGVKGEELSIKGYSPQRRVYTYNAFTSHGEAFYDTGTVDGDIWTWLRDEVSDGKLSKGRYTMRVTSPTSYTFQFESSVNGRDWSTVMTGNAKKR